MKKTLLFCFCAYLSYQNVYGMEEINQKGNNLKELQSKLLRKQKELIKSELSREKEDKKIIAKIELIIKKIDSLHKEIVDDSYCCFSKDEKENLFNPRNFFHKKKITGAKHGIFVLESTSGFFSGFSILCPNIHFDSTETGGHYFALINTLKDTKIQIKKSKEKIHKIKKMMSESLNSDAGSDEDSGDEFKSKITELKDTIKQLKKTKKEKEKEMIESVEHLNHVAGIIGSQKYGLAPDITVHLIEPLEKKKSQAFDLKYFIKTFLKKNEYGSRVISCSEDIWLEGKDVETFCQFLEKNDLVFLNAAGNERKVLKNRKNIKENRLVKIDSIQTKRLIHVGNFDMYKSQISKSSNLPGEQPYFLYAPGTKIKTEIYGLDISDLFLKRLTGTSMSAPFAAGIFALLDQSFSKVKMSDIISVVLESCHLFLKHRDPSVEGYGLMNGVKSFQTLKARFSKKSLKIHPILHGCFFQESQGQITLLNEYVIILDKMNFPRCAPIIYGDDKKMLTSLLTKKEFDYSVFQKAQNFREKYKVFDYTF